ncbi:hypothetical protein HNV11_11200 [Spirosoma taeanense]|uniref:Lipoprotein n=1 Tax=Spirosoma taeanense TaxID=2735870 RepID=A0A6M5YAM2_9BACT|nr:hypothetical protein [Spirosoma taeanense]QJW89902.1 hypothetical protein HNV11_11200 [Spirosoma taeanense]
MLIRFPSFFALLSLLLFAGCQTTSPVPIVSDTDFFPLKSQQYIIYDVQEQRYALNAPALQLTYQLKEVVGDVYRDVTGQTAYRLLRYRRLAEGQSWQADSVWSARLVNNEAIRTENGLDFIKLVFPFSDQLRWNGNRRNIYGEDAYELRNNPQPYRVLDKQFDETVTVVAQNDSTLVSQDKRVEVYARQVGLIYKERTQLQYCSSSPACRGKNQIDYGIRQVYRIRTYGTE